MTRSGLAQHHGTGEKRPPFENPKLTRVVLVEQARDGHLDEGESIEIMMEGGGTSGRWCVIVGEKQTRDLLYLAHTLGAPRGDGYSVLRLRWTPIHCQVVATRTAPSNILSYSLQRIKDHA